jgi:hypothetical protein
LFSLAGHDGRFGGRRGYQSTFVVSAVLLCAAAYLAFKAGGAAGATEPRRLGQRAGAVITRRSSVVDFTL